MVVIRARDKNGGGFTLLEVIISIAALSLISVFILQMFLVSSTVNNRAKDTDMAMAAALTEIESLKAYDSVEGYLNDRLPGTNTAEKVMVSTGYDADWNVVETGDSGARFMLTLDISAADSTLSPAEGVPYGRLYNVGVVVTDLTRGKTVAELRSKKYFPVEGGNYAAHN